MTLSDPLLVHSVVERKSRELPRYVAIPFDAVASWSLDGTTVVEVSLNGLPIGRRSLKYWGSERECWFLDLTQAQCDGAGIATGDRVSVQLSRADTALPAELAELLDRSREAAARWESLTPARRRQLGEHVRVAKKAQTRHRRARKALLDADGE